MIAARLLLTAEPPAPWQHPRLGEQSDLIKHLDNYSSRLLVMRSLFCAVCVFLAAVAAAQQTSEAPNPPASEGVEARRVVQEVIENELRAEKADKTHWMFLDRLKEPGKDDMKEVVQTDAVSLQLLTTHSGRRVSEAERKEEMAQLHKLASNSKLQREQRRSEREDGEKAQRMLKMLPDAFRYQIESRNGDRIVLSFVPDPKFQPSTHEATVFHAMAGTLAVDTKEHRLVEIRGHLVDDVKFGFGILGHLDKGGRFLVRQQEVNPGIWEIAELDVEMTGKALFFKSINLHQQEWRTGYRRLPNNLSPEQGLALLASEPNAVAQK